jgi:hypothetical protein
LHGRFIKSSDCTTPDCLDIYIIENSPYSPNLNHKLHALNHSAFANLRNPNELWGEFEALFSQAFTVFDLTEAFHSEAVLEGITSAETYQNTYFNDNPIVSIENKLTLYLNWSQHLNSLEKPIHNYGAMESMIPEEEMRKLFPGYKNPAETASLTEAYLSFATPELEVPFAVLLPTLSTP